MGINLYRKDICADLQQKKMENTALYYMQDNYHT